MPACAEVNKIIINYNTREQNKDMSVTRQDRDWKDTNTVLSYLSDRNPFTSDIGLHKTSTGVHAHSSIDVDQAKTVGKDILIEMKGAVCDGVHVQEKESSNYNGREVFNKN